MTAAAPTSFRNAEVDTKANVYFDGKVVSHTVRLADGTRLTLGLIWPGSYHFGTAAPERMQIVAGTCRVRLDGSDETRTYPTGSDFFIPGNSGFDIAVDSGLVEYVCTFG